MNALDRFKIVGKSTLIVLAIAVLLICGVGSIEHGVETKEHLFTAVGAINICYGVYNIIKAWNSLNNK